MSVGSLCPLSFCGVWLQDGCHVFSSVAKASGCIELLPILAGKMSESLGEMGGERVESRWDPGNDLGPLLLQKAL